MGQYSSMYLTSYSQSGYWWPSVWQKKPKFTNFSSPQLIYFHRLSKPVLKMVITLPPTFQDCRNCFKELRQNYFLPSLSPTDITSGQCLPVSGVHPCIWQSTAAAWFCDPAPRGHSPAWRLTACLSGHNTERTWSHEKTNCQRHGHAQTNPKTIFLI